MIKKVLKKRLKQHLLILFKRAHSLIHLINNYRRLVSDLNKLWTNKVFNADFNLKEFNQTKIISEITKTVFISAEYTTVQYWKRFNFTVDIYKNEYSKLFLKRLISLIKNSSTI